MKKTFTQKIADFFQKKSSGSYMEDAIRTGNQAQAGVSVNYTNAMTVSAVYACVRNLAETVAQVPLVLYRRTTSGKEPAVDHPVYSLLKFKPNEFQNPFQFRENIQGQLGLRGNAFLFKNIVGGEIKELLPLPSSQVTIEQDKNFEVVYKVRNESGQENIYTKAQILHVCGFSIDGLRGVSPITLFRNAIGLALVTETFGSKLFSNGAVLSGTLSHPGRLTTEQKKELSDSIKSGYSGAENALRVMVLEQGLKWDAIGLSNEDSQFLQTRKFQKGEIATIYRMPPHMIGDLEKATFSNIEQQSLEFVVFTLMPWLRRTEEALMAGLLSYDERAEYFIEHNVDGLLRGDIKSRYEAYSIGRQNGWLNADDIRERENMNRLPNNAGQEYLSPLNMVPAGTRSQGANT